MAIPLEYTHQAYLCYTFLMTIHFSHVQLILTYFLWYYESATTMFAKALGDADQVRNHHQEGREKQ